MDFSQADEKFRQLKARYEAGEVTEAEFKSRLQDLMVQDEDGAWWMIGYETERWYRHDGTDWVQADPPGIPSRSSIPAGAVETTEAKSAESAVSKPAPAAKEQRGDRTLPIVIVGALLLVASIFIIPRLFSSPAATPTPAAATEPPAATEAPTEAPAASGNILYRDDFSDTNDWPSTAGPNASVLSVNGWFVMQGFTTEDLILAHPGQNFSDVSVEVDAAQYGGTDDTKFGLICRYQDNDNYYYFMISRYGYYVIGRRLGGIFQQLSSGNVPVNEIIKTGDATNRLRADCGGSILTLYANRQQLASAADTSLTSGDIGLVIFSGELPTGEVSFDNFVVRAAQEAAAPAPTEALAAATEAPIASGDILYQDDFSSPNGGWAVVLGSPGEATFTTDGQYRLRAVSAHAEVLVRPSEDFTDARIEVDATPGEGIGTISGKYGLVCRYQDEFNFYLVMIDEQRGWFWVGRRDGNANKVLVDWTRIPRATIYNGSATVHLRADCVGSTLTFYVNGEEQGSVTDSSLSYGSAGLLVFSADVPDAVFLFDNFVVRRP